MDLQIEKIILILLVCLFACERTEKKITYYKTGNVKSIAEMKDGKIHGKQEIYYPSGTIQSMGYYKKGQANGVVETFFENGELETKCAWKDGYLEGNQEQYFKGGGLFLKRHFSHGVQTGKTYIYSLNGEICRVETYDSLGNVIYAYGWDDYKKYSRVIPIIKIDNDTISLDMSANLLINFGYKLSGSLGLQLTGLDAMQSPIISGKKDSINNIFNIKLKFKEIGLHKILVMPTHSPTPGDTLSANGNGKEISIFVRPSSGI